MYISIYIKQCTNTTLCDVSTLHMQLLYINRCYKYSYREYCLNRGHRTALLHKQTLHKQLYGMYRFRTYSSFTRIDVTNTALFHVPTLQIQLYFMYRRCKNSSISCTDVANTARFHVPTLQIQLFSMYLLYKYSSITSTDVTKQLYYKNWRYKNSSITRTDVTNIALLQELTVQIQLFFM